MPDSSPRPAPAPLHKEHRWPAVVFTAAALGLYLLLPQSVAVVPNAIVPIVGGVMLVPLIALNPHRLGTETTLSRWLSVGLSGALVVLNQVSVVLLVRELVSGTVDGPSVLLTALAVWLTNAIAFGLIFWELDRGGPVARRTLGLRDDARQDFRFPQQEDRDPSWEPGFVDYLYVALTNMMAFSPTDVMPLTTRAKGLMAYQALTGFVLLALVISRAVNILT